MINNENQNDVYLDCSTSWPRDLVAVKWGLKQPRLLFPCEGFERRFASLASSGLWSFGLGQQQAAHESRLWTCDMEAKLRRGKPTSSGAGRTLWESALSPAWNNKRLTSRVHMPLKWNNRVKKMSRPRVRFNFTSYLIEIFSSIECCLEPHHCTVE